MNQENTVATEEPVKVETTTSEKTETTETVPTPVESEKVAEVETKEGIH
jgi:hypothetical protein